jgi:predicted ATP-binding protein involved in virulence
MRDDDWLRLDKRGGVPLGQGIPDTFMRIDRLHLHNFRCFADLEMTFHPQFNLIVGENGSGKTSLIEALTVAAGSWFLGITDHKTRNIADLEIRRAPVQSGQSHNLEPQYPVVVEAEGLLLGSQGLDQPATWKREKLSKDGKTVSGRVPSIKRLAEEAERRVQRAVNTPLPLISAYGAGRVWVEPKDMEKNVPLEAMAVGSRLQGYQMSIDPRIDFTALFRWLAKEKLVALQEGAERFVFQVVKRAMRDCLEGCTSLDFDVIRNSVVADMSGGRKLPYHLLSDGQRAMLAMVADIAIKAAVLNPQLMDRVLAETTGVVLIDEIELHLHPRWQRHVVRDLKATFPRLQFFATTHSPQVVGETPHEQIRVLRSDGTWTQPQASIGLQTNEVLSEIMRAPTVNQEAAREFEEIGRLIDEADFDAAQQRIVTYRQRMGNLPELEAREVYMARVDALAGDAEALP